MKLAKNYHQALLHSTTNVQGSNTQQTLNFQQPILQSSTAAQQTINSQGANTQQPLNLQQSPVQSSVNAQHAANIQGLNKQQPSNLQQTMLQTPMSGKQASNSFGVNTQQVFNLQQLQPSVSGQHVTNLQGANTQQPISVLQSSITGQQATNSQGVNALQPLNQQQSILQPPLSGQQVTNLQVVNAQQPINVPNSILQTPLTTQQANNLQQPKILQPPVSLQQVTNSIQPSNLNQDINIQSVHQILEDVPAYPNTQILQQYLIANPNPNTGIISVPSSQPNFCNVNSPAEVISVTYPQSQQVSNYGVPSYVIDMSQVKNSIPATVLSQNSATLSNQPPIVNVLSSSQENQPLYVVQNPSEQPNQITIRKSIQPHSTFPTLGNQDQNQINLISSALSQAQSTSYADAIPTISSILASKLSSQASKSSNLKALLPLIFNLIKERDGCGCHHHCGCRKNPGIQNKFGDIPEGYLNQRRYIKPDVTLKYSNDDSDEVDSYENGRNSKIYSNCKKIKPESAEYDYSEEFLDD